MAQMSYITVDGSAQGPWDQTIKLSVESLGQWEACGVIGLNG